MRSRGNGLVVLLCLLALIAGIGWVLYAALHADNDRRERFMQECLQYEREYQCTAKWRAGESRTTIMPMVVPTR